VAFGPYNTIFAVAGLLFVVAGLASIGPMRSAVAAQADAAPERAAVVGEEQADVRPAADQAL
jgi:hypothetical protein